MADWYGAARSNYFKVRDLDAFRKAFEGIDVKIVGSAADDSVAEDGLVCLLGDDQYGGWPSWICDEETDEDREVDVVQIVAGHLADGEVAVFMQSGAEKLRYITGYAVATNNKGETRVIDIDMIYDLAKDLGPNVTQACY